MKVYSCPNEIAFADPDYANYDHDAETAREAAHQETVKAWLMANGYAGPRTGEVLREAMGDGYALYMYGDGPKPCLIHLPYGDAYLSPNVPHLPKKEILRRLDGQAKLATLFSKR